MKMPLQTLNLLITDLSHNWENLVDKSFQLHSFALNYYQGSKFVKLRLGAQSVTLLSTMRDPTQLRRHPCAFRKQPLLFVPM